MTAVSEATSRSTVPPASGTLSPGARSTREADIVERSLIDASTRGPVLALFATGIAWLLLSTLLHLLVSVKLHTPGFLGNVSWLTYGRVYPAFQNALLYGWCSLAGMGVALWLMARLCRVSVRAPGVLIFGVLLWNLGLVYGIGSILLGQMRPLEGLEMPMAAHALMFLGFMLIGLWGAVMFRYRRSATAFISVWYLLGALFWFPWIFAFANIVTALPQVRGVMEPIVAAWYLQNLHGWWITALGLAAAYFFIPKVLNRPIHSYNLASIGFWSFAFLAGLTGMVRLTGGPIPVWLASVSIAASLMMFVPVVCVAVNLIMTVRGEADAVFHSPTVRFTLFGAVAFVVASVFGILSAFRSVDRVLHFTQFATAQQQMLVYAFFSMVMFGAIYYITPRLVGCEWLSSSMISVHFWGSAYGGGFLIAMLIFSGLAGGFTIADPQNLFTQASEVVQVYSVGRTIALIFVALGHVLFALHFLLMLLRIGQPGGEPTLFAPADEENH